MLTHGNDIIQISETITNFDELEAVNTTRMAQSLPFYAFAIDTNNGYVMRDDKNRSLETLNTHVQFGYS
jgi:hypothetical protein